MYSNTREHAEEWPSWADPFWSKVDIRPGGCWLWTGNTKATGYGLHYTGPSYALAHRYAYATLLGDQPLPLDHLCGTKNCVNPNHLEPVTTRENHARRVARKQVTA